MALDKKQVKTATVIKERLKELHMSAAELSRKSSVPHSTISAWLSNAVPKNPVQAQAIADALGITLYYLYWGEQERFPQSMEEIPHELQQVFSGIYHVQISKILPKKMRS